MEKSVIHKHANSQDTYFIPNYEDLYSHLHREPDLAVISESVSRKGNKLLNKCNLQKQFLYQTVS